MAKGVVLYPATNTSVGLTPANIVNYGVDSVSSPYKCCARNDNNGTQVPVVYGGKVGSSYAAVAVKDFVAGATSICCAKPDSTGVDKASLNSAWTSAGVNYRYINGLNGVYVPLSLADYEAFTDFAEMAEFVTNITNIRIKYISGVVGVAAPTYVQEGSVVRAFLSIPRGVTVTSGNITVKKNNSPLSFTYSNGILTFTA